MTRINERLVNLHTEMQSIIMELQVVASKNDIYRMCKFAEDVVHFTHIARKVVEKQQGKLKEEKRSNYVPSND